jgi:hypothetical protein
MTKTKLYMGLPSTGERSDFQTYVLRDLEKKYGDKIDFIYPEQCTHRKFHDFARNAIVEDFLASGADILWFLDSDIAPPSNVLDLITVHGEHWDLAGAPYPVFMTPEGYKGPQVVMCVYKNDERGLHASAVPNSGLEMVDGLATGCIFIKRDVFSKLQKPYFEFKFNPETRYMTEGEDLGFCRKVNELGYKFLTDYSMVCKHYKMVDLLEVNNYAIDYSNQAVLAYDAQIRDKVSKLALENVEIKKRLLALSGRTQSGLLLPK